MQKTVCRKQRRRGITAVEMLVGLSILSIMFLAITYSITQFINTGRDIVDKTQALYLAEEGIEMVKFIRDNKWSYITDLTDNTTYYLQITGSEVSTSTSPEVVGQYTRSFEISPVERDGNDDIVSSGTPDPDTKYLTVTVSWGSPTQSLSLATIIADINNP